MLIDWAASLEDPFASNSHKDIATVVKSNWDQIQPELADRHNHPAILATVCSLQHLTIYSFTHQGFLWSP